jgi:hypothetical protein
MLNTLDFIETGAAELEQELSGANLPEFPDLTILRSGGEVSQNSEPPPDTAPSPQPRSNGRDNSSIEDVAAKLGIRIIK